jgi:hypothetical protein
MTMDVPGYEDLAAVLTAAFDQAARGKGKERHANGRAFTDQPIFEINRMLPSKIDGAAYQVIKKTQEACSMAAAGKLDAAKHELLGAIVYAAATYLLIEEKRAQSLAEQPAHKGDPRRCAEELLREFYGSEKKREVFDAGGWPSFANGGFVGGIDRAAQQSEAIFTDGSLATVSLKYLRELEEYRRQVSHYRAQRKFQGADLKLDVEGFLGQKGAPEDDGA